ncbi:multidrug effflux MFS transporter [Latilactobacillus fuchuensis]|uniref:multidrug effflux MFS transporter n=1 Tax=Latilactobacillus fuchuensis TaxID=164393 RepID=UPI0020C766BE|nr:multidrug effflux MFS transporter [Latilactobacillus fuchuensis]MCP8857287.1 multidrug effflux MFS transporter [Latilactobacillus fuchuensis]
MQFSKAKTIWLSILLGSLSAFGPLLVDMYLPAFPTLQSDFRTSASMVQLSLTMCLAGLAVGPIFIGAWSDRVGRRQPLLIGMTLALVACLLSLLTHNIWIFFLLRFIQGIASSAGQVVTRAVAKDLFSGRQLTKFIALLMAINGIFPIISPLIGSALLNYMSWRGIFGFISVVGALLLLGLIFGFKETHVVSAEAQADISFKTNVKTIFKDHTFIYFVLIQGLVYGAMFCYISGSSFMLQNVFSLSKASFSIIYAVNGAGIILMAELSAILIQRFTELQQLKFGLLGGLLGSVFVLLSQIGPDKLWLALIGLFLVVSTLGLINAVVTSLALQRQGQHAGIASSVLGLGMYVFGIFLSPLVGILGSHTYAPLAILIFGCEVAALVLYHRVRQLSNH